VNVKEINPQTQRPKDSKTQPWSPFSSPQPSPSSAKASPFVKTSGDEPEGKPSPCSQSLVFKEKCDYNFVLLKNDGFLPLDFVVKIDYNCSQKG